MYQTLGSWTPRWGSFASSAFPVALMAGLTTQLFEPTPGWPRAEAPVSKPASAPIPTPIDARRVSPAASRSSAAAAAMVGAVTGRGVAPVPFVAAPLVAPSGRAPGSVAAPSGGEPALTRSFVVVMVGAPAG